MSDKNKKIMKQINEDWCDLEDCMGEQAALHVACEQNGKDVDWFYDHVDLIGIENESHN